MGVQVSYLNADEICLQGLSLKSLQFLLSSGDIYRKRFTALASPRKA
jgi:hypothetical protein